LKAALDFILCLYIYIRKHNGNVSPENYYYYHNNNNNNHY